MKFRKEFLSFLNIGGDETVSDNFAGHLADRLSALESNLRIVTRNGETLLMQKIRTEIAAICREAAEAGYDRDEYPGLFR